MAQHNESIKNWLATLLVSDFYEFYKFIDAVLLPASTLVLF